MDHADDESYSVKRTRTDSSTIRNVFISQRRNKGRRVAKVTTEDVRPLPETSREHILIPSSSTSVPTLPLFSRVAPAPTQFGFPSSDFEDGQDVSSTFDCSDGGNDVPDYVIPVAAKAPRIRVSLSYTINLSILTLSLLTHAFAGLEASPPRLPRTYILLRSPRVRHQHRSAMQIMSPPFTEPLFPMFRLLGFARIL